ncbi:MAG TPA: hypoxanthine phosphoribosyltransferase [Gemmatimonadales bacterium]
MTTPPPELISAERIAVRVGELAGAIDRDYAGRGDVVFIGVLKGAFVFLADLARKLTIPHRIEFMASSSYGANGAVSGGVRLLVDLRDPIEGQHVVLVEDIVDSGDTLTYLTTLLASRHPASVRTCALVRKPGALAAGVKVDYLGFDVPDSWIVGYGLDYAERFRTLPYLGTVEPG